MAVPINEDELIKAINVNYKKLTFELANIPFTSVFHNFLPKKIYIVNLIKEL